MAKQVRAARHYQPKDAPLRQMADRAVRPLARDMRAALAPYRDCGCGIAARTAAYLRATQAQVVPLYALEKQGAFRGGDRRGEDFAAARLAAGAAELRDMIVDAWRQSLDAKVGYPPVAVRDVLSGKVNPIGPLLGLD